MYKYKYLLVFFCAIAALLLIWFFPICFDNNDDQTMYAICSGLMTGVSSPNLILTNILTGKSLSNLFVLSKKINWYTLYLQTAQGVSFLFICWVFIRNTKSTFFTAGMAVLFILAGFFSQCFVRIQFTTVALFCGFAALLSLQIRMNKLLKFLFFSFFITIAIFIRKDAFYIFMAFSLPVLLTELNTNNFIRIYVGAMIIAGIVFIGSNFLDSENKTYKEQQTHSNVKALDIIAANPIKIDENILQKYRFTRSDILLLQSWLVADDAYLTGGKIEQLAKELKTNRNISEIIQELKKFAADERYLIFVYGLTGIIILLFARNFLRPFLFNLIVFSGLLLYLTITARIPHRVTFPILTYLILLNVFYVQESNIRETKKHAIMLLLLIVSGYKFYCTSKLIQLHKEYHQTYNSCRDEITAHPESLFIAADGFPLQYMNAWQTPKNNFPARNVILAGWYACTPDYKVIIKFHQLKNLTTDLKNKKNILFLTESLVLQDAYVKVMKERYNIVCHFEEESTGFKALRPKRLVFDN